MSIYPDLSNTSIFSQAGVAACQYAINDAASGLPLGSTGAIAAGQIRPMGRYIAIKDANDQVGEPRVITASGDNGNVRWQYVFNPAELGVMNMNFGAFNQNAYVAFSDTKIETLGEFNIVGLETNRPANAKQATLLLTMDAQDGDSTNFGQARFSNYFYPSLNVFKLASTAQEVQAATFGFRGVPQQVSKTPWGKAFTIATNGYTRTKCIQVTSRNPMTMDMARMDGTTVTWTLGASPDVDETATGLTIFAFRYQSNGTVTQLTITDINIATRQVTVNTAGTSGDILVFVYSSFDILAAF